MHPTQRIRRHPSENSPGGNNIHNFPYLDLVESADDIQQDRYVWVCIYDDGHVSRNDILIINSPYSDEHSKHLKVKYWLGNDVCIDYVDQFIGPPSGKVILVGLFKFNRFIKRAIKSVKKKELVEILVKEKLSMDSYQNRFSVNWRKK